MKKSKESGLSTNNLGIIVEAKHEYTQQLCNVIRPIVYECLLNLYNKAVNVSESTNDILYHFQKELTVVPTWNNKTVKEETTRVLDACSYFNELITAVFLSNVKILSSVKLGSTSKKFQLVIPTNENFIHHVYIKVCKKIFDNPYLFSLKKYNNNIMNNMSDTSEVIDDAVAHSVRDMLPIKNILESYICKDISEENLSEEENLSDEEEPFEEEEPFIEESFEDEPLEEESEQKEVEQNNNTVMGNLFEKPLQTTGETREISLDKHPVPASEPEPEPEPEPELEPELEQIEHKKQVPPTTASFFE